MAYTVIDSRGNTVANIGVATTTGTTFPVELIGEGISPYGGIISNTQYHIVENFANAIQPLNPIEGMDWYNATEQTPYYRTATEFVPYATGTNSTSVGFTMLPTAKNVDFGTTGMIPIFTAPGNGFNFHPTQLMLIPKNVADVTTPANFNIHIATAEDVLETATLMNATANRHHLFNIQGSTTFAQNTETVSLEITLAGSGGGSFAMEYDVWLFGFINKP